MIPTDKEMAALIKKIQKEASAVAAKKAKQNKANATEVAEEQNSEIFNEMKKRPYTS